MTKQCHDITENLSSSTEETKKKGKSEKTNKEVSVVDATKLYDISIVNETEGSDEERKEN